MQSIYITTEAVLAIAKSGSRPSAAEPPALEIQLIDEPVLYRCSASAGMEHYEAYARTSPPSNLKLKDFDLASASGKDIFSAADCFEDGDFKDFRVEGIEQEDTISRLAILSYRALASWLPEHPLPELAEGAVYMVSGPSPEGSTPSGDARPELAVFGVDAQTGETFTKQLPFFDGRASAQPVRTEELLKKMGECEGFLTMSKTITDPKTGEPVTIPIMGDEAKGIVKTMHLTEDGKKLLEAWAPRLRLEASPIIPNLGADIDIAKTVSLRVFLDTDTLKELPEIAFPPKAYPPALLPKALIELTDVPLFAFAETDREKRTTRLDMFNRNMFTMFSAHSATAVYRCTSAQEYLAEGPITLSGSEGGAGITLLLLQALKSIAGLLLASGESWSEKPASAGCRNVLLHREDGTPVLTEVNKCGRPPVMCRTITGMEMCRPYADEAEEAPGAILRTCAVTPERIAAAGAPKGSAEADGRVSGLRALAKQYETGIGVPKDLRKAVELYREALALAPGDKDLEFDLFMVEMLL